LSKKPGLGRVFCWGKLLQETICSEKTPIDSAQQNKLLLVIKY
jgi:hypothetical protein